MTDRVGMGVRSYDVSMVGRYEAEPRFTSLVTPWLLQGVLLICVVRGAPPFLTSAGTDVYSGSGLVSGTVLYALLTGVWLVTMVLVVPGYVWSVGKLGEYVLLLSVPLLAMLSTVWSTAPKISAGAGFQLFLLTVIGIYIANQFEPAEQMKLFMIVGIIAAVSSLLMAVAVPATGLDQIGHSGAVKGIFTQKNTCGSFMLILATPAFFVRKAGGAGSLVAWGYGLLCGLLVYLSQSRTSWMLFVAMVALAIVLAVLRAFKSRDALFIGVSSIVVGGPVGWFIYENLGMLSIGLGKDSSFSGRTLIWQAVLGAIAKRSVLGYGYSAFFSSASAGAGDLAREVGFTVNHPHNGYLSVWLDLGVVGLVLLGFGLIKAFRDGMRARLKFAYTDWYVVVIVMVLLSNIDERGLLVANDISWLMFVVACAGLHLAARRVGVSRC